MGTVYAMYITGVNFQVDSGATINYRMYIDNELESDDGVIFTEEERAQMDSEFKNTTPINKIVIENGITSVGANVLYNPAGTGLTGNQKSVSFNPYTLENNSSADLSSYNYVIYTLGC